MNRVVVIIPIYKNTLTEGERASLIRCFKVLGGYKIVFISPSFLDLSEYKQLSKSYDIDFYIQMFDEKYLTGTDSYNKLMLSQQFYNRFTEYEYMLICQLDAYVFKDDLKDWCEKGYDYIGAPIIGHFTDNVFSMNMRVGNGGFSLRKISVFANAFNFKKNLLNVHEILKRYEVYNKPWTRIPLLLLMKMGFHNNLSYFAENWKYNEDDFWSSFLDNTNYALNKPDISVALEFAFDRFPSNCFELTKKLPFGCHAWERYEYETFWRKFIRD